MSADTFPGLSESASAIEQVDVSVKLAVDEDKQRSYLGPIERGAQIQNRKHVVELEGTIIKDYLTINLAIYYQTCNLKIVLENYVRPYKLV